MLDVADNNKAYYYHFDGLGSVVALSNSNGDSCQSYEYSAYGQVVASDPNFLANSYMFTGRRFDIETGLYYYRARYYNPHIGRFMQTDHVGYGAGINWYLYCGNNTLAFVDPSGRTLLDIADSCDLWPVRDSCDLDPILAPILDPIYDFCDISPIFLVYDFCDVDIDIWDIKDFCDVDVDDFLDIIDDATDTLEDVYIGGPKRFPQQFPLPDPFWPPTIPDIPYETTQTPEQQKQIDDLTREGMGEDATGRDASGNSSFIFPKSGGGGCTFIIVPLEIIGPFLQSIGIDIITPRPRPPKPLSG
jgi:RHS repeat-associated protein